MTFINPFVSPPTDSVFIQLITNSGVTLVDGIYNGTTFQPYMFQAIGTNTHTFRLPDPRKYSLQVGVEFIFMNSSTQTITIQASDSSFVCTVLSLSTIICTMTSMTSTNSSWTTIRSNVPSSGILPLSLGGTGSSSALTTPTASHYAAYDSSLYLRANQFISPSVLVSGNQSPSATGLSSVYIYEASGSIFTLPLESLVPIGQTVTLLNNDTDQNANPITIAISGHTDTHSLPPGFGVTYIMSNPSGSYQAWIGMTFQVDGFGFGEQLSFTPKHTYGATVMNIPYNSALSGPPGGAAIPAVYYQSTNPAGNDYYLNQPFPFNFEMNQNSSTTVSINSAYVYPAATAFPTFPQVFLPDVATIPIGSTYRVFFNNQIPASDVINYPSCQYQVRTSKSMGSDILVDWNGLTGGQANSAVFVCISNDDTLGRNAWNVTTNTAGPNVVQILLDVAVALISLIPVLGEISAGISLATAVGVFVTSVNILNSVSNAAIIIGNGTISNVAAMTPILTTVFNNSSTNSTITDSSTGLPIVTYSIAGSITTAGLLPPGDKGLIQYATRQTVPPFRGTSLFMRLATI